LPVRVSGLYRVWLSAKILVVEDDEVMWMFLAQMRERVRFDVKTVLEAEAVEVLLMSHVEPVNQGEQN
jgi:CheY-like chemotaxis protein